MKSVLASLVFLLSSLPFLTAQDDGTEESRKARGRQAWFVATSIPDDLENPAQILTANGTSMISLSKRMSSGPVRIPSDGIIRMVREQSNPGPSSDTEVLTLAEARIPESVDKALVILIPVAKSGTDLMFRTKVQNLADFKGGDCLYLNLTSVEVAAKLGDKSINIKPGKANVCKTPGLRKSTSVPVSYHYFNPTQEKWKLLSASTIVFRPTRREICIFSWDERYKRLNYHGITFPVEQ